VAAAAGIVCAGWLYRVSALSRGIMTLSTGWQAFHTTFFVVILTTTTLVCARNIVMNFPGSDAGTWAVFGMALEPVGLVRRRPGGGVRVLVLPLRGMIDIK